MHMDNTQRKKLLFLSTRQFWPTSSGKDITLYHDCRGLYERCGYEIHLLCFADKTTDKQRKPPDFIHSVVYLDVPPVWKTARNIVVKSLLGGWPIQNSMFYSRQIKDQFWAYYRKLDPSAVVIDMVRLAPYGEMLREESVNKILIEDDLLAKRYRRQIASTGSGSIAGYMAPSLPGIVNKLTSIGALRNIILRGEIKRLERYEQKCTEIFDHITFISQIEADEFNRLYSTNKAIRLTLGADIEYCNGGVPEEHRERSMSIVGNFYTPANIASLEWINAEIMPKLPKDVILYVVGKYPEEMVNKIDKTRISMLGYVDDIRSIVKSTEVYLSPIVFGTGIKTKIVEAMAMGLPVVTNKIGAEGLDVHNGEELFIADDPEDIVEAVLRLFGNASLRAGVGNRGRTFVQENHNWSVIFGTFGKMGL